MKLNYDHSKTHRTLVFDLDDTISSTTTHDWQNATPNWQVINKMNNLYDDGWQIIILTARGQVSCDGDVDKADKKYRNLIENWLKQHDVKYHVLSFNKYLAVNYIDDKGLTPEQFVELEFKEIKTGWSGAQVEKRGDRIYKTSNDSLRESLWYNMASPLINVPIVYNVIGNTICLEFLKENGNKVKIEDINHMISIFSLYKTHTPFNNYINKIEEHCKIADDFYDIIPKLKEQEFFYSQHNSFCHGDFSLENLIQTNKGLYLIDPIWKEDYWSSYLLDISKMMHSYRKYNRMFEYEVFLNTWLRNKNYSLNEYSLKLLEITQFIRVLKHVQNEDVKQQLHNLTKQLMKDLKC